MEALKAPRSHRSLQNILKCTSKTYLISKYFFKESKDIVITVTQCSFIYINKDFYPAATCNSAKVMYFLTC